MTDYHQNPDPAPRGRHVRNNSSQPNEQGAVPPVQPAAQRQGAAHQRRPQQERRQQGKVPQSAQQQVQPQRNAPTQAQSPRQAPAQGRASQQRVPQQQVDPRTQRPPVAQRHQPMPPGYRPAQVGAVAPATRNSSGGNRGGLRNEGKKKSGPWKIVFWAALVVLLVALVALGAIAFSYWQGQSAYDTIAEETFIPPADIEGTSLTDITVDWEKLKAINPDTIAWVYIPDTKVNYPIVHTDNDEKYLTTDFNGQQTWGATYGAIFLSAENAPDFSDANSIIYGHHLNNGAMFADIVGFEDAETFNKHRVVYILTPQGNFKLRTFSLVHCAADDPLAQTVFADEAERTSYMQDKADRSVVPATDVPDMAAIDHAFAFATCDNLPSDGRFVLYAYVAESTAANISSIDAAPAGDVVDPAATETIEGSVNEQAAA